jgi:hypothetical protein
MNKTDRSYGFVDGRLVPMKPPEWFAKAVLEEGSWNASLTKAGALALEDFGDGGDTLDIYQGPSGDYFIGYWDCNECVAQIFIDNVPDYLMFRAKYIAPLASLIMESDRHHEWREAKKRKRAS